jgi:Mn2+/Fe2+ NRAMP family transporter
MIRKHSIARPRDPTFSTLPIEHAADRDGSPVSPPMPITDPPPPPAPSPEADGASEETPFEPRQRGFLRAFGPGLLFAGAAVGVSHLVQSTRAGATFGVAMISVVLIANLVKFPAFRFGPHYAAATGRPILSGYRRQGVWTLLAFSLLTLATMFTVAAAVTVVTAGVAISVLGLGPAIESTVGAARGPASVSAVLLVFAAVLLAVGGYPWLDRFMKLVMPVLVLATLVATVVAIGRIDWSTASLLPTAPLATAAGIAFTAAVVGWMPSAIDISVWSSLWTLARARQRGVRPRLGGVLLDFDVGYVATTLLAIAFVLLGTGVMFGRGIAFEDSAGGFAAQVVEMYTDTLGPWSGPVIGLAALLVMLSTTVAVMDGFPRVVAALVAQFRVGAREEDRPGSGGGEGDRRAYRLAFLGLAAGTLAILFFGMSSFKALVDLATTLSFLTAPVLSWFNHRAVFGPEVPRGARPGRGMWWWSAVAIALQGAFAAWYLSVVFG